jgi:hypothetical protein
MFETVNRLAVEVVKASTHKRRGGWGESSPYPRVKKATGPGCGFHPTLAAEIASLLPVRTRADFERLDAQLIVLRTLLRLNPPFSAPLRARIGNLMSEAAIVRAALKE